MMTDPIADMLTRIRNAQAVRKSSVAVPFSKLKKNIADILSEQGYVGKVERKEQKPQNILVIRLKYNGKKPAISYIQRESKPGHRIYAGADQVPKVLNGYGITILSTSRGLMTGRQAEKQGIGGEVICSLY